MRLLLLLLLNACGVLFVEENFPCASDGSCPSPLTCSADNLCVTSSSEPPGRECEGEEEEGEGEGEEGEGEEGEGEGEGEANGFVFSVYDSGVPSDAGPVFALGDDGRVWLAGAVSAPAFGRPAPVGGTLNLFVASAPVGGALSASVTAVVDDRASITALTRLGGGSTDVVLSGKASPFIPTDTLLGGCVLAEADRLTVFSAQLSSNGCVDVRGRVSASSSTEGNVFEAVPFRESGARFIFGARVSTSPGAVFDLELPTTASFGLTDYGTMFIADDGAGAEVDVAESFFLDAADPVTSTIGGASDPFGSEPQTFRGINHASIPDDRPTGIIGGATGFARSSLLETGGGSSAVLALASVNGATDDDVIVVASVDDATCAGLLVMRVNSSLQGDDFQQRLCTNVIPFFGPPQLVVDDGEALVLFFAGGEVRDTSDGFVADPGIVALAVDVDSGLLTAAASFPGAGAGSPGGRPAFGAMPSVDLEDDSAIAVAAHRSR